MKVVLEGTLTINVVQEQGPPWQEQASPRQEQASPWPAGRFVGRTWKEAREAAAAAGGPAVGWAEAFKVDKFASGEEALFAVLMFLLQSYREGTSKIPTHEILTAVTQGLQDLLMAGRLPPPSD